MRQIFNFIFIMFLLIVFGQSVFAVENHIVAGAGPSTKITTVFFEKFAKQPESKNNKYSVMKNSVKHRGGIVHSDSFLFGRTGRPLNSKELALGKSDIFLAKVPIAFVKGLEVMVDTLTMGQIEAIFTKKITNWMDVGGPDAHIILVGREATEALYSELKTDHSFFNGVTFDKKFKRDDDVVKFLTSFDGKHAIAFGAKANFSKFNLIEVSGFDSGAKLGLVVDNKNSRHYLVKAAIRFTKSTEWKAAVKASGMLPVD